MASTKRVSAPFLDRLFARLEPVSWRAAILLALVLWSLFWALAMALDVYDYPFQAPTTVEPDHFGLDPLGWTSLVLSILSGYMLVMWIRVRRLERGGAAALARFFGIDEASITPTWQRHLSRCRTNATVARLLGALVGLVSAAVGPPGFLELWGLQGIYPADKLPPPNVWNMGFWYVVTQPLVFAYVGDAMHATLASGQFFTQLVRERFEVQLFKVGQMDPIIRLVQRVALAWAMVGAILALLILDAKVNPLIAMPLIAIPSIFAIAVLVGPMLALHDRVAEAKRAALNQLEPLMKAHWQDLTPQSSPEAVAHMGGLLAMETRIKRVRDWPMDLGSIGRLLLYVVIPLLSWSGAAVVERAIDSLF